MRVHLLQERYLLTLRCEQGRSSLQQSCPGEERPRMGTFIPSAVSLLRLSGFWHELINPPIAEEAQRTLIWQSW